MSVLWTFLLCALPGLIYLFQGNHSLHLENVVKINAVDGVIQLIQVVVLLYLWAFLFDPQLKLIACQDFQFLTKVLNSLHDFLDEDLKDGVRTCEAFAVLLTKFS